MKKEQPKKLVQVEMNQKELEAWGSNRYYRNTWKAVGGVGIALFLAVVGFSFISDFVSGVFVVALLGLVIWWMFKGWATGRKFWQSVKDKPEPLQL